MFHPLKKLIMTLENPYFQIGNIYIFHNMVDFASHCHMASSRLEPTFVCHDGMLGGGVDPTYTMFLFLWNSACEKRLRNNHPPLIFRCQSCCRLRCCSITFLEAATVVGKNGFPLWYPSKHHMARKNKSSVWWYWPCYKFELKHKVVLFWPVATYFS